MYRLFLCLHYLRSRVIAYFAVLGVALCVAMMLIVVSVMNGFLDKIESAAKGLLGDIVIDAGQGGMGYYDDFMAQLQVTVPQVEAASPSIQTYAILQIPGQRYRQPVTLSGIRMSERAKVSDFEQGLWVQQGHSKPSFDPPVASMRQRVGEQIELIRRLERQGEPSVSTSKQAGYDLEERLHNAAYFTREAMRTLEQYETVQPIVRQLETQVAELTALAQQTPTTGPDGATSPASAAVERLPQLEQQLGELTEASGYLTSDYHAILGLGVEGLMFRTPGGQTVRYVLPGDNITLTMVPMGRALGANISPNTKTFLVVDDARTGIENIDSSFVYLPFETLQLLNDLGAEYGEDGELVTPARTRMIHVKVRPEAQGELVLREVRDRIQAFANAFQDRRPLMTRADIEVRTWRQQQAGVIEPIEAQRTLTMIMFSIISLVSVVLIFVIFYMIVFQKTRDIGVLKSIGASSGGVAAIFLTYGAIIGLVGSILGTIGGYYFVRYINPIHDAADRWFGFRVWSREVFMFDMIPNQVHVGPAVQIVIGAIIAGLLGALLPALRAARMQPVEALRYE